MRSLVEEDVLTQIEATFAKDKKIVIGSIGPGGCFQDWMLFSKLILMGYCDLEIHMADPIFKNDDGKRVPAIPRISSISFVQMCVMILTFIIQWKNAQII